MVKIHLTLGKRAKRMPDATVETTVPVVGNLWISYSDKDTSTWQTEIKAQV